MDARLYIGNLPKSTTQDELNALFAQAGEVITTEMITDRRTGESRGFAFVTMNAQSDADKAISMFNAYSFGDHDLKVSMATSKPRLIAARPIVES